MIRQGPKAVWLLSGLAALVTSALPASAQTVAGLSHECLAGHYQGAAAEIAAELVLHPNGRYSYALTYGALDESSDGRWSQGEGGVLLNSDPVKAPRFDPLSKTATKDDVIRIVLSLPQGMSAPWFDAHVLFADGTGDARQFTTDFLELDIGNPRPKSIRPALPIFGIAGAWQDVPRKGGVTLRYRFEPNDLGKVAFANEPFAVEDGAVRLLRHGRSLRLHLVEGACQPS